MRIKVQFQKNLFEFLPVCEDTELFLQVNKVIFTNHQSQ